MKTTVTLILVVATLLCSGTLYASASNNLLDEDTPFVVVEYFQIGEEENTSNTSRNVLAFDMGASSKSRSFPVVNLGTNGSSNVGWFIFVGTTVRSASNYTTASGNLVVRATGSITTSITFCKRWKPREIWAHVG